MKRSAMFTVCALLTGGCTDAPTEPQPVDSELLAPSFAMVTERATGSGHFDDFRYPDPQFRSFSFAAIEKADGGVTGQWELNNRNFPLRIHGVVDCISVSGNQAWFAGATTASDDELQIGVIRAFRVIDNGEGMDAEADEVSFSPAVLSAQDWCDAQLPQDTNPIEEGNVQIN